jgi:hypothetical protein
VQLFENLFRCSVVCEGRQSVAGNFFILLALHSCVLLFVEF